MIYVYTALYAEAKPVIRELKLKKSQRKIGFDVYENESVRLVMTGVGTLEAATAVGSSLGFYCAGEKDVLLNWGSCAGQGKAGEVYLCHKLVDHARGRCYYPDMLVRSPLPEACVITETQPWRTADGEKRNEDSGELRLPFDEKILHDMEAAAVYGAGAHFLGPHQMHFLKAVSDSGEQMLSAAQLADVMEKALPRFVEYLDGLLEFQRELLEVSSVLPDNTEEILDDFCCSHAMRSCFRQYIRYWALSGINYESRIRQMREQGELPCRSKREGLQRMEKLRRELIR